MKRIVTVSLLLICLLLAVCLSSCGGKNEKKPETPLDILKDAIDKTAASRQNETTDLFEKALNGGSIELLCQLEDLPITEIRAKDYFSKDKAASTFSATASSGSTLAFSAFSDAEKMIVSLSALEEVYGVTTSGLSDLLERVISSEELSFASANSTAALEEALRAHEDELKEIVTKYITITVTPAESSLTISLSLSSENIIPMIDEVTNLIKNDQKLMNALVSYFSLITGEEITADTIIESMDELKTEISAALDLEEENSSPSKIDMRLTCSTDRIIQRATLSLYKVNINADGTETKGEEAFGMTVVLATSGGFELEVDVDGQTITIEHKVDDDDTLRKETFSFGASSFTLTPVTFIYDKIKNTYDLTVEIPNLFKFSASGSYTQDSNEAVLTIDGMQVSISNASEYMLSPTTTMDFPVTATLTIKASDTMPQAPKNYTDASKLTDEELEEIEKTLKENEIIAIIVEMFSFSSQTPEVPPVVA